MLKCIGSNKNFKKISESENRIKGRDVRLNKARSKVITSAS